MATVTDPIESAIETLGRFAAEQELYAARAERDSERIDHERRAEAYRKVQIELMTKPMSEAK